MNLESFLKIKEEVLSAREGARDEFRDSYFEINYEELVEAPKTVLKNVFSFLKVDWYDGLERFEGDPEELKKIKTVTGLHSPTAESIGKPLFLDSIGRWNRDLTDFEARLLT